MSGLLGPDGRPISTEIVNKKAKPPVTGNAFGDWAGRDITFANLPGGGVVQFDLSRLTIADFRNMKDHYQINSSLSVLMFMLHQSEFRIECDDKKIADFCQGQMENIWTRMNRALSQAHWAGFSPNVLDWENDVPNQAVNLDKIKDLIPEECCVNWKLIDGWSPPGKVPPKYKVYNGIKQFGAGFPYPVENTLWYPMLMENGDYYGRKLLRPAFTPWFFSLLVHLFSNRYFERFGEPVPVGRAPFDEELRTGDGEDDHIRGSDYMGTILQNLRSRGVVVLPNDRTDSGTSNRPTYDYDIEYLESQMRGADFERYLTRLDEEMSIGLFTPILLLRTADVGSYNLGVGHTQMYLWILNSLNADRKSYIDPYVLSPMVDFNFSPNAPRAKIKFQKLGNVAGDMMQALITALIQNKFATPDLDELGQMAGLSLKQINQSTTPPPAPADPNAPPADPNAPPPKDNAGSGTNHAGLKETTATAGEIISRVRGQVQTAFREHTFDLPDFSVSLGYKRRFEKALGYDGVTNAVSATNEFYTRLDNWIKDVVGLGEKEFSGPESFMAMLQRVIDVELDRIADATR